MTKASSHELAALLLTEAICYATLTLGIALWVLLLDKQSAFDSVLKEHILSEAYTAANHHSDQSLLYMANRLATRRYLPTVLIHPHGPNARPERCGEGRCELE